MAKLLTSVRDLPEAMDAIDGGSDWIDLKEPSFGVLGAVTPTVAARVVAYVAATRADMPVSATIGDCWDDPETMPGRVRQMRKSGVEFIKVGLYADRLAPDLINALRSCISIHPRLIAVCFAERPPTPLSVRNLCDLGVAGLMLDTARKSSGSLLDLLRLEQIREFVSSVINSGRLCGLAGSLTEADAVSLCATKADYLGFRGALCTGHKRTTRLSVDKVRSVKTAMSLASLRPKDRAAAAMISTAH